MTLRMLTEIGSAILRLSVLIIVFGVGIGWAVHGQYGPALAAGVFIIAMRIETLVEKLIEALK